MDALTHAVETYIGRSTTKETRFMAEQATRLIYKNLKTAYDDGQNVKARENMLQAAYCAGIAFSRSYLAMSMPLPILWGAKYGVPHGLANAVILPYFLEEYGPVMESWQNWQDASVWYQNIPTTAEWQRLLSSG